MTRIHSGPWSYDANPPTFGEQLTILRLEWCLDTLAKLGCAAHTSSRFPESLRYLKRVHDNHALVEDAEVRTQVAEIQRATWQLMLVLLASVQSDRQTSPFTSAKLRELQGGGLAADGSHARNTEFELYVSALFVLAGFDVRRGTPDSRLRVYNEDFGIEAKRITSVKPDTLRSTLAHAARQITGKITSDIIQVVRLRGFIAVNLDGLFESVNPTNNDELVDQFNERLEILDHETRVLRDKVGISGLMACGHVARWRFTDEEPHWRIDTLFALRWVGLYGEDPAEETLARHLGPYIDGVQSHALALRPKLPKILESVEPAA
jgi:hypothetical protein